MSTTYTFASYDPFTNQQISWVQTVGFYEQAAANADTNVIQFRPSGGISQGDLIQDELNATLAIESTVPLLLGGLRTLDPKGFFNVAGWGKIGVSELITLLARADWEIHPNGTFNNGGPGAAVRNGGDPVFKVERDDLIAYAQPHSISWYILHELGHVTMAGWAQRNPGGNSYETITSDLARAIAIQIQQPFTPGLTPFPNGFGNTVITYVPGPSGR